MFFKAITMHWPNNDWKVIIIRAFIGIDFDKELKEYIFEIQQQLKKYAVKGRWKYSGNLHLTLKFLEEVSPTQKGKIDEAMGKICEGTEPFSLGVSGLGIFQGRDSIRVLWMGIDGNIMKLKSLHKIIDEALVPIGFSAEARSFRPHITIGQDVAFHCGFDEICEKIGAVKCDLFKVENLYLFKSEQIQNKRVYTKVSEYTLSKK